VVVAYPLGQLVSAIPILPGGDTIEATMSAGLVLAGGTGAAVIAAVLLYPRSPPNFASIPIRALHGKQGVCRGLPPVAGGPLPGKEGVDGSSPSEGFYPFSCWSLLLLAEVATARC